MGGFAFARLSSLSGMACLHSIGNTIIPFITLIPVFLMMRALGWIDTLKPLIIPALVSPLVLFCYVILSYDTLELEAARMMAVSFGIYWRILCLYRDRHGHTRAFHLYGYLE